MAFSCVILATTSSARLPSNLATDSGALGQVPSECGKSDSQHTLSTLKWPRSSMPIGSLMKQHRTWSWKICVGPPVWLKSCLVHPECRSCTCSARQRKYGIQPMSPSVSENRRSGNRGQNSAHSRSTKVKIDIVEDDVIFTLAGASAAAGADRDDEPTWQHRTVPTSEQAANNGSHSPEWIDGICNASGFSENVTA